MQPTWISLVVPAYNEGTAFLHTLERLDAYISFHFSGRSELIVVNDGSADDTGQAIADFSRVAVSNVKLVSHETNRGLTEAIKSGVREATGDCIVLVDADLSYAPEFLKPMVDALRAGDCDVVVASPYMRGGSVANVPIVRLIPSRVANAMLHFVSGSHVSTFTGMVRAYRADFIKPLVERAPIGEFNTWVLFEAISGANRVGEIPARLEWPQARREGATRMPIAKLAKQTKSVWTTLSYIVRARRHKDSRRKMLDHLA